MGIRGLTTFIARHADKYFESYKLHDTYLVIDGNNLAMQMYRWHCNCYDCFGGDYDKYARKVMYFFDLLSQSNVIPLIVFDGGFEKKKLKTIYARISDKIRNAKHLTSATEGSVKVFPLFIRQLFQQIVIKLNLKVIRCDFEADNEMACIARVLNCPVLSYDSDFYVSDILYIPFSSLELRLSVLKEPGTNRKFNAIPCEIYRVDKFLKSFGGLDRSLLPLIGILLGNDYVELNTFRGFYKQIKLTKKKFLESRQQRRIHAVIKWLQGETYDSAVAKILNRSKARYRAFIAKQIDMAKKSYITTDSKMLKYFNLGNIEVKQRVAEETPLSLPYLSDVLQNNPNDIIDVEDDSGSEDSTEDMKEEDILSEVINFAALEVDFEDDKNVLYKSLPEWFLGKYRTCEYPAAFMDFAIRHRYFATPQHEDYNNVYSDYVSHDIISAIHTVLTSGKVHELKFVARENLHVKSYSVPKSNKTLPKLEQLNQLTEKQSKVYFLSVLDMELCECRTLDKFPPSWRLYLIAIKYWSRVTPNVAQTHVYALLLCLLVMSVVDEKIGFHRSIKNFTAYFEKKISSADSTVVNSPGNLTQLLCAISEKDALLCMKQLVSNFHLDDKLRQKDKYFDICTIDVFAKFQSCLFYIIYLNVLLNKPFEECLISDFYNGTFIYNVCNNFKRRSDLDNYISQWLNCAPTVLQSFKLIITSVTSYLNIELLKTTTGIKRRRKKKSNKKLEVVSSSDGSSEENDESVVFDENNRFSLLQLHD